MKKLYPIIFFITVLMLVFIISANVTHFDVDLWARLVAGMGVVDGHQVLKTDMLSYAPTHVWWDHEYGSGAVFYFFLKYFGAYSLIFLQTAICFVMFFIITRIIKLRGYNFPYNFVFWLFSVLAFAENFGSPIRCQLFSFLFFTIFLYILEYVRRGKTKLIYLLPILTVLWNNLHGGVVSGLGLIALFGLGEIIEKKSFKHYIYAGLLSLAALIINPWGIGYIKFLFMANLMPRPDIAEWWGIFSKHQIYNQIPFKIFLVLITGLESYALYKYMKNTENFKILFRNADKTKILLLFVTVYLAVCHVKMIPFFVITASAYCYGDFEKFIVPKLPNWTARFTLAIIFLICVFSLVTKKYEIPVRVTIYPVREVEFIKINGITGNILADFGHGSYIAYKLYPHNKIFMDGRYEEVYYDDMIPLLKKFYLLMPDWEDILKKYPPDIMIIEKRYPVYKMLNKLSDWKNIYETRLFIVYVKREKIKKSYIQPPDNYDYYKNTLFDTDIKF